MQGKSQQEIQPETLVCMDNIAQQYPMSEFSLQNQRGCFRVISVVASLTNNEHSGRSHASSEPSSTGHSTTVRESPASIDGSENFL